MVIRNRIVRLVKCMMVLAATVAMTPRQSPAQQCVECATGCAGTTVTYVYGDLMCSCPTSSNCVDSGGILCTTCVGAGRAYCWDTANGCGGLFNNNTSNACGCKSTCRA